MAQPRIRVVTLVAFGLFLAGQPEPSLAGISEPGAPPPDVQSSARHTRCSGSGGLGDPTADARLRCSPSGLRTAIAREAAQLARSSSNVDAVVSGQPQGVPRRRSWAGRHPVLFGAIVGFVGGYLIGYLPGDDAVFDDFTATANGVFLGGIGAGTGALAGGIVSEVRK